ncbi:hypothetical protein ZIOFF_030656 [Zingiber officinale]|uniref:eIF3a PCI domain-containing protein n=1 Tax=Zingiber officinale TaxID=94328 RepID=A0A8J5H9J8_ZINOF|nr:hypothetical protein ZIOFF_030656 [Zingiber officinale]
MVTFAKPKNALKRAEELVNVGQKHAALQALHDLITSKEEVIKHSTQLSTEIAEKAITQVQALEDVLDMEDLEADKRLRI